MTGSKGHSPGGDETAAASSEKDARLLLLSDRVCDSDAHGAEHGRILVNKDGAHSQRPRDGARVLPARAAKAGENVISNVVALQRGAAQTVSSRQLVRRRG